MNITIRLTEEQDTMVRYLADQLEQSINKTVAMCIERTYQQYKQTPQLEQLNTLLKQFRGALEDINKQVTKATKEEAEQLSLFDPTHTEG